PLCPGAAIFEDILFHLGHRRRATTATTVHKSTSVAVPPSRMGSLSGYIGATLLVLIAMGIRLLLVPWVGSSAPFFLFPAILIGAWVFGFGPGLWGMAL